MYVCMYACMYACIYVCMYVGTYVCMYVSIHYVNTAVSLHVTRIFHRSVHIYIYIHMCIYIYGFVCTRIHTYRWCTKILAASIPLPLSLQNFDFPEFQIASALHVQIPSIPNFQMLGIWVSGSLECQNSRISELLNSTGVLGI